MKLVSKRVVLIGAAILVASKLKSRLSILQTLLGIVAAYSVYSKRAPPVPVGASPPGAPKALPWFGHIAVYPNLREHMHEFLHNLSVRTNFKSFALCFPDDMTLMVLHDERDAKYILKDNFQNYVKCYNSEKGFHKVRVFPIP